MELAYDSKKPLKRPSLFVVKRILIRLVFDTNNSWTDTQKLKERDTSSLNHCFASCATQMSRESEIYRT